MTEEELNNIDVWLAELDKDNLEALGERMPALLAEVRRLNALIEHIHKIAVRDDDNATQRIALLLGLEIASRHGFDLR